MIAPRLCHEEDEGKRDEPRGREECSGGERARDEGATLRSDASECVASARGEQDDDGEGCGREPCEDSGEPHVGDVGRDGGDLV